MINDIKGIEILYTHEVITNWSWGFSWIGLFFILLVLLGIVSLVAGIIHSDMECGAIGIIIVACGAVALLFFSQATPIYTTEYYTTIDEKVSMVEVLENYEVKDVKDQIYVLRPRNN